MSKRLSLVAAPLFALASLAMPALAEDAATAPATPAKDAATASTVVATVNGTPITIGHMILMREKLPQQYKQLDDDVLFKGILDQLVNQTLLEQDFTGDTPARVTLNLENERRTLLAAEVIADAITTGITDEEIQKAYDEKYASAEPEKEFNAAHILVETEEEAKAIIEELEGGADFEALAKEKSTGPSGPSGGNLGWFGKGAMVPEFEAAVTALEPGKISPPVKTQFGWHVVKLLETRLGKAPSLDEVRHEIEAELQNDLIARTIDGLAAKATIDRAGESAFDPAILKDTSLLED